MKDPKILDSAWRSFSEAVIPAAAPDIQRVEMRRAFYAGAGALLGGIMRMLDPGEEPTDDDMRRMDAIKRELDDFNRHVRQGRA